jgi:hypothetical protein
MNYKLETIAYANVYINDEKRFKGYKNSFVLGI